MTNQRNAPASSPSLAGANSQQLLDNLPYAIAILDAHEQCVMTNHRWLDDYRMQRDDLVGKCFFDVMPTLPEDWRVAYQRALTGETVVNDEQRVELADGYAQFLSWRMMPWHAEDNAQVAG